MKKFLKILAIGIGFAILGNILAGCDGSGNPELLNDAGLRFDDAGRNSAGDAGLQRNDAGHIFCSIPSPTGDEKSPYGIGRNTQNFDLVANDVTAACNRFKASPPVGQAALAAGIDCSDAANDFEGTSGMLWCISTYLNGDSTTSSCVATITDVTCQVTGMDEMKTLINKNGSFPLREYAACSPTGVFLGWICTNQ